MSHPLKGKSVVRISATADVHHEDATLKFDLEDGTSVIAFPMYDGTLQWEEYKPDPADTWELLATV